MLEQQFPDNMREISRRTDDRQVKEEQQQWNGFRR